MSGSHRERDEKYSAVVAVLAPGWRVILCKDGLQWIIQRRAEGRDWRSLRFCASKSGLLGCIALAPSVTPQARRVIEALPENACADRRADHHAPKAAARAPAGERMAAA